MTCKTIYSLIGRAALVAALGAAAGSDAYARHLEPAEALSVVDAGKMKAPSANPLKLTFTQVAESGEAAVYVFDREGAPGFYVLAADDAVGDIVLGYSDTNSFRAENMPENVKWLLDAYSQYVSDCAAGLVSAPAYTPAWSAVEPLLTTKWTQRAPYNDFCPNIFGEKAITGCVAVAVGQVMKKHKWPTKGNGSNSYSYILNGQQFDISSNFSQHTYDWNNMLDSYNDSYTTAQKNAVAQLLFDCGVTANTVYVPYGYTVGSAGNLTKAAAGMIQYFDYDKSMLLCNRSWYSDEDWKTLMYNQLSQGLPVLYSGRDSNDEGHAFVLDGYDGAGKFHFNMGWAGNGDGHYTVDGISYINSQEAVINVRKNIGSAITPEFAIVGKLTCDRTQYKASGDNIIFKATGVGTTGFFSYSLQKVRASIGFKNTSNGQVAVYGTTDFDPQTGFATITIQSKNFPKGDYEVYPVFKAEGGDWTAMKYDRSVTSGRLHFVNNGSTITVGEVEIDGISDIVSETISVKATGSHIHIDAPGNVQVAVYDMTGRLHYSGRETLITVTPNRLYIVVINGKAYKVKA